MNKVYKIEVDCANCANLMEAACSKLDGVTDVSVNFMTQKMSIEFVESCNEKVVMKEVVRACRKIEPDFEIEL